MQTQKPDESLVAAQQRFLTTGLPFYTSPDRSEYLCSYCGGPIPDGNQVATVTDSKGNLTGVVASADDNPYTDAVFTHRCGAGIDTVPDAIAHHDRSSPAAAALRVGGV